MEDEQEAGFFAKLRSSPRRRRQLAWLAAIAIVLAGVVAVLLIVPNQEGAPPPADGDHATAHPDGGTFWFVAGIVFAVFLLAFVYMIIRFVWRISRGDSDEGAGSDGYTWRNSRKDLEDAMFPNSEPH